MLKPTARSASTEERVVPKSVLLISYCFPPMPGAGALRPGRLARLLPAFGWIPTTLTGPWHGAASDFGEVVPITRLGDPFAARVRGLWRVVPNSARWFPKALGSALAIAAGRHFDAVVSVCSPAHSHVIAAIVARRRGIPWLADYSDAWNGNMFAPKSALTSRLNRQIEVRCAREAAAITCATTGIQGLLTKLHRRPGVEVIENAVDHAEWASIPNLSPKTFTILYAGNLYGGLLNPELLFGSVRKLRGIGHPAGAAVRFEFYGNDHQVVLKAARRLQLEDAVIVHPVTMRERVLHAERQAAALLMLFPMNPISVVPSKLYEYFGARRPILAIGPDQSRARLGDVIEGNRLGHFATTEDECAAAICSLYERFTSGRYQTNPLSTWSPPTALTTTKQFATVLDRIAPSKRSSIGTTAPVIEASASALS